MYQRFPKSCNRVGENVKIYAMKTLHENRQEMFIMDELDREKMLKIRGGTDPNDGDPSKPIIK